MSNEEDYPKKNNIDITKPSGQTGLLQSALFFFFFELHSAFTELEIVCKVKLAKFQGKAVNVSQIAVISGRR